MITQHDDYFVHQTPLPIAQPNSSDRNFYDRCWMNGYDADSNYFFEVGFGLYPNRRVMDGHFSVVLGDKQYAFHASRRAPKERNETKVGPFSIEVLEPLRKIKVTLEPNEHNIECELIFEARTVPHEEPPNVMHDDGHLIMHNSRFTQLGKWNGHITIDGNRVEVSMGSGARDRSWGVRPVGEPQGGAPGLLNNEPGVYWVWCPINFGDVCTQFGTFEDRQGVATQISADLVPVYASSDDIPALEDPGMIRMSDIRHSLSWNSGTRLAKFGEFHFTDIAGNQYDITVTPVGKPFYMLAIGYQHPEWAHACWKGELETAREEWDLNAVNSLDLQFIHTHQVVKAKMGDREGLGTLETIVIGRHVPSGFKDFFDGAE